MTSSISRVSHMSSFKCFSYSWDRVMKIKGWETNQRWARLIVRWVIVCLVQVRDDFQCRWGSSINSKHWDECRWWRNALSQVCVLRVVDQWQRNLFQWKYLSQTTLFLEEYYMNKTQKFSRQMAWLLLNFLVSCINICCYFLTYSIVLPVPGTFLRFLIHWAVFDTLFCKRQVS